MIELILGGARSGKSRFAEQQAAASGLALAYIATAEPGDAEMAERIHHHQQRRGAEWALYEAPLGLASTLVAADGPARCLLVDCLTLWVTNALMASDQCWQQERAALVATLPRLQARVLLVSNETGLGVVPPDALSRRFVDETGRLHQALAGVCQRVTFIAAGLPMTLKDDSEP